MEHENSDFITIVGSAYYQPITDLIDRLLQENAHDPQRTSISTTENGYACATIILLITLLESFTSRIFFLNHFYSGKYKGKSSPCELIIGCFPDIDNKENLEEVLLLRNIITHNHVWHFDPVDIDHSSLKTLKTAKNIGFKPNKNYDTIVEDGKCETKRLHLPAYPTAVGVREVGITFHVVWETLCFMNKKSSSDTPLVGQTVGFRGKRIQFSQLLSLFPAFDIAIEQSAAG
ncbi:hypothetical protein SAMN02745857_00872 [Andreprevotia lacus DSM 23236]|jgi:hypothetical protein|uniref:Uncharacterized protein n=1 Tax=Andreprevotia lacus DSM 23236 TaxID=1121001 RepID=A0A1W1X9M8_9NEIS|nr:hypothetical protein [Andreprevotia lacus]SMC20221.1 hypothetical protein SAMN02745857_00872 [Andreprevotia lacus DSM 23236]